MKAALRSGWKRVDVWWERIQEAAQLHFRAGREMRARLHWRIGLRLAKLSFPPHDLRRATSLANMGFALFQAGHAAKARSCYLRAAQDWPHGSAAIDNMRIAKQARSSLHHMRMELEHAETYRENIRRRLRRFFAETQEAMEAMADGKPSPYTFFPRWKGEKPPCFDDRRKILGACLLIAVADEQSRQPSRSRQ